jgi:hypothetical protein
MKQKQNIGIVVALIVIIVLLVLFYANACSSATPAPAPATTAAEASPDNTAEIKAEVLSNVNLRSGPGTNYAVVGSVPANSEVTVIGRTEDGQWLRVKSDAAEQVWVTADAALIKIEQSLLNSLPIVEAPALPYDVNNPKVNDVLNKIPLVLHNAQSFTCASHGGLNNPIISLQEGHVIGPHAGDFVMGQDNVLFKYTGGSLVLIRENPVARFEGGAETLPFDKAMQLFQNGEIVWTGTFGQSPGRGVTGCDPAMK